MWSLSAAASSSIGGGGGAFVFLSAASGAAGACGAAFLVSGFSVLPRLNQPACELQASRTMPRRRRIAIYAANPRVARKPRAANVASVM